MRIESLSDKPDRAGRYLVRLDNGVSMRLYRQTVEDHALFNGKHLSDEELSLLRKDAGQMSAWYIFTALGFYPVHPTAGEFVFGSPLCTEAVIHTVDGTDFKVVAHNNSAENIYIQSVTLNGKPYDKFSISHSDIMKGGELVFEMTDKR